jgi:peptide-methionine (S)-S-oxide reductase
MAQQLDSTLDPELAPSRHGLPERLRAALLGITALFGLVGWLSPAVSAEINQVLPAPLLDQPAASTHQAAAVLAGGCFWGVQGVFQHVRGVSRVVSGYAGGSADTAQYDTVSGGDTGHAESVEIDYDPSKITYGQLLQIYFSVALDPTQMNRQGPDTGTQYRSVIFAVDPMQEKVALHYIAQLSASRLFNRPIATRVAPFKGFYPAEAYHQNYLTLHPDDGYIAVNDIPKVDNLKRLFPEVYQAQAVLVAVPKE